MNYCNAAIVTGGLGFIGKNFTLKLLDKYKHIYIVDKISDVSDIEFYKQNLACNVQLLSQRVKDLRLKSYVELHESLDIYHFAAESHVDNSFHNGPDFVLNNAYDTAMLLQEICAFKDNVRLVMISTDEVYGESNDRPFVESDPLNPTNPYSASKAAADVLTQTYARCFGVNSITVRANNIYGCRQFVEKLIPRCIQYASQRKIFEIHGDGSQLRHFLHTDDFSSAIFKLVDNWDVLGSRIFNIAGDSEYSVKSIVSMIYGEFSVSDNFYRFVGDRPYNDKRYFVDDSLIRSLGWSPIIDFNSAISRMCSSLDFFVK